MNSIIRFSLNNKFALWIMTAIVVAAGLYAGVTMKQETIPDINVPVISITTVYPGASPEEVANNVTRPLEQRLKNVNGVDVMMSNSLENVSSLLVQYKFEKDMKEAVEEAREVIDSVSLPQGAMSPDISRISINAFPVLALSVSDDARSLDQLTALIEEDLRPALEGLDGVSDVQITGQYVREAVLTYKQDKLAQYGIDPSMVEGIVKGSALKVPLGMYAIDESQKTVVVDGAVSTLDDLRNLQIPLMPGGGAGAAPGAEGAAGAEAGAAVDPAAAMAALMNGLPTIPLSEIADIELIGQAESISRTNGKESIGVQIVKAPDANTVEVVNGVKDAVAKFQDREEGINVVTMLDQGEPIEHSVTTMLEKALFGALFAILIILLFLRNFRSTLIAVLSIPLSLLIGVLLLQQMDITLNMMTLGAMTVAIGRVVDDSIVVIENIYRRMALRGEQLRGKALVLAATKEMFVPIMSSTIVTIAVFLPLGLVSGMVGELFMPFALTMVFALLASLLVSITLVPMMGHSMFRNGLKDKHKTDHDKPGKLAYSYQKSLRWALNHKFVTFTAAVLLLAGSIGLGVAKVGFSFLPEEEQKYVMLTYSPAPSERLEDVAELALKAESYILDRADVTDVQYSVGGSGNPMSPGPSRSALFYVLFEDDVKNFEDVKKTVLEDVTAAAAGQGDWGKMDMAAGFGAGGFSLTVFGDSYEEIRDASEQIRALMEADPNFENVDTGLTETYEQLTFKADQSKLAKLGLTAGNIAMELSPVRERPVLTTVVDEGEQLNVYVQTVNKTYNTSDELIGETLTSPLGIEVPISDVAAVERGESPNAIAMLDGRLYTNVTADTTTSDVGRASTKLQTAIDGLNLPKSIEVEFGGVTEQIYETFTQLGLAMLAAVAIVYLILVITFGGGLAPFAILFSLPFTVIGAVVALMLTGLPLDVSGMMGLLMLIGIVVTNAIVLIDRVRHMERDGMTTREALLEAAATRLRPILMTALATIGALLPMLFGVEGAGIISKGLAVTVIGGLTSSTLLTLIIVPAIYEVLMRIGGKRVEERI